VRFSTKDKKKYDVAIAITKNVVDPVTTLFLSENIRIGLIVVSVFIAAGSVIALIVLISQRRRKILRVASIPFSVVMILGCIFGCLSSIPYAFVTDLGCALRPVGLMVSFTLAFVPLVLKTYRICRLFASKKISKIIIRDSLLGMYFAGFLLMDFVIIILWMSFESSRPVPKRVMTDVENQFVNICYSEYDKRIGIIVVVYKSAILLAGLILAYISRKAPSLFNESKAIVNSFYQFIVISIVTIILQSLISKEPTMLFVIQTIGICLAFFSVTAQVFFPKFILLLTVKDEDLYVDDDKNTSRQSSGPSKVHSEHSEVEGAAAANKGPLSGQKELVDFQQKGRISSDYLLTMRTCSEEAVRVVTKSETGFKVTAVDLAPLREIAKKLLSILENLDQAPKV